MQSEQSILSAYQVLRPNANLGCFITKKSHEGFLEFYRVSPKFCTITGYTAKELLHRSVLQALPHTDASYFIESLCHCLTTRKRQTSEEALQWPRGKVWWRMCTEPFILGKGNTPNAVFATIVDSTEKRRLGQGLVEAQRKSIALLNAIPDVIFRINRRGIIIDLEEGSDSLIGLAPIDVLGKRLEDALPKGVALKISKELKKTFRDNLTHAFRFTLSLENQQHDFEARLAAVDKEEALAIVRDISDQVRAETNLKAAKDEADIASKAKSAFLANMSHELRTPLNAIIGFSDMMVKGSYGQIQPKVYGTYAEDILESGQHLLHIINDILDISKIEAGRMELVEQRLDINNIIRRVIRIMSETISTAKLTISTRIQKGIPSIMGDERILKQILFNLLSNAVKFTPRGGKLFVSASRTKNDKIKIIVRDTGVGISPEHIETALSPFGQVDNSLSRHNSGTGLGLPLVKSLVELHDGIFTLESRPQKGTTATCYLPQFRIISAP